MTSALNNFATLLILLLPAVFSLGNGVIDVTLSTLVIIYLVTLIKNKDFKDLKANWFIAFAVLWAYLIVRGLFVEDIWVSLKAGLPMLRFPLLALAVAYFIRHKPNIKSTIFFVSSIVLIFLAMNAFVQISIGHDIFTNLLVQHEHFFRLTTPRGKQRVGYTCAFIMLPLLGYFLDMLLSKRISNVYFYIMGIAIILGFATIVLSGERLPLAITIFTLVVGLLSIDKLRKKVVLIITIASTVLVICIALSPQLHYRLIGTTTAQLTNFQNDAYGKIYKNSYLMFLDNKLFGIGTNQFATVCPSFTKAIAQDSVQCATHPHNYYLQILAENGLLGLALLVLAVVLMLLKVFKGVDTYYALFAGILVLTKFIPIAPSASFYIAWSSAPIWFAIGLALTRSVEPQKIA